MRLLAALLIPALTVTGEAEAAVLAAGDLRVSFVGEDEAFLLDAGSALPPAQRTTALLARCLTRLGPLTPTQEAQRLTPDAVRDLTVGDREALLLHLRRLTLGNRLQCVLSCPDAACGERMDLDLRVSELLLPPYPHPQPWHETTVRENGTYYRVRFRLPTGADQEAVASLARHDAQAAADLLLRRCVDSVSAEDDIDQGAEDWPPAVARRLPAIMADLDPQAALMLNLTCPVCGYAFSVLFDTAAYFFQEISGRLDQLYREVHLLAFYYHWSEAEIMGMTTRKRQRYLDLLTEALMEGGRR
jgi:hypothetical protein